MCAGKNLKITIILNLDYLQQFSKIACHFCKRELQVTPSPHVCCSNFKFMCIITIKVPSVHNPKMINFGNQAEIKKKDWLKQM